MKREIAMNGVLLIAMGIIFLLVDICIFYSDVPAKKVLPLFTFVTIPMFVLGFGFLGYTHFEG